PARYTIRFGSDGNPDWCMRSAPSSPPTLLAVTPDISIETPGWRRRLHSSGHRLRGGRGRCDDTPGIRSLLRSRPDRRPSTPDPPGAETTGPRDDSVALRETAQTCELGKLGTKVSRFVNRLSQNRTSDSASRWHSCRT